MVEEKKKFLTFALESGHYALPLWLVREVIVATDITPLPNSLEGNIGVINVRGEIISVIDLSKKLGGNAIRVVPQQSCVIICQQDEVTIGLLVEAVVSVKTCTEEDILLPQATRASEDEHAFVSAFVEEPGEHSELLMILDFAKLLAASINKSPENLD